LIDEHDVQRKEADVQAAIDHKVGPTSGERADFPRLGNRFVLRGEDTGGRFALVEHTIGPRTLAAPMHVHEREDEYSYVLAGRLGVQIGDDVVEAGPGELVLKPRGIPHAFWNPGDEEARVLEIVSPAGFEQYFAELVELGGSRAAEGRDLGALAQHYGLEVQRDSIPGLLERFGVRIAG